MDVQELNGEDTEDGPCRMLKGVGRGRCAWWCGITLELADIIKADCLVLDER